MVTQAVMGSLYDLTLDEVESQLGNLGKPLGSMNLDELLRALWSTEAIDNGASGSSEFSKKTVEELWREIQGNNRRNQSRLGAMTLEEFLGQAGVSVDPNVAQNNSQWIQQYQMFQQHQRNDMMPNQQVMQQILAVRDSGYSDSSLSPTNLIGRKRVANGDVVEKTVERRQKRMIKNRESAARSRARRQAYTQELENKVARLEDENRRLRRLKEVEKVIPSAPPPKPKYQLRRTTSSPL